MKVGGGGRGDRVVIGLQCPEKESISPRYVKNRLAKFPPMHPRTRSCSLRPQEHLVRPRAIVAFPSNEQQQQRPVDKTNVPRLSRLAMRNPAPHPAPSAPHPTLVNGTTSRPSRPATALVACETVGRPEGFRLGHHFEKHTKKLRVSQWAETTVACVYDPR